MMFIVFMWNPWLWAFHAAPKGRVIDYRHSAKARKAWGDHD